MEAAVFQTPFLAPERSAKECFRWCVEQATVADEAGYTEYWLGEHATQSWESIPNPELVIAAAALQTERIKLAPGAHLLPYHNPGSLAIQVAFLTQVLEGRYILGVGAGAYPADGALRGVTDMSVNHPMMLEALDLMEKVWAGVPFHEDGKYFSAGFPTAPEGHPFRNHILPWGGKVDIGCTGLSPNSPSIGLAGQRGWLPLSVYAGDAFLANHWETYKSAAEGAGRTADRSIHHVVRDVFVADTDVEAKKLAIEGGMGRAWGEYLLPVYKQFGILKGLIKDESMSMDDIDLAYLAEHVWIVGSPETVIEKFQACFDETGGWGTHMIYSHDYIDNPEPWNESQRRFAQEVAPKIMLPSGTA